MIHCLADEPARPMLRDERIRIAPLANSRPNFSAPPRRAAERPPSGSSDATAWNSLRDALGPDVPDVEIFYLVEEHGANVQAAVQAYFDAQSSRQPRHSYPGSALYSS